MIGTDPPPCRTAFVLEALIEGWLETVKTPHPQLHALEIANGWNDDLGCERQRRHDHPGGYRPIIRPEWCPACYVIEELSAISASFKGAPAGTITGGKSPAVLAIALKLHRISDRIFLLHKRGLAAVLKIVTAVLAHEFVADVAEIDPHM